MKDLRSLEYASVAWATKSRLLRGLGGFSEYFASLEVIVGRDFYGEYSMLVWSPVRDLQLNPNGFV